MQEKYEFIDGYLNYIKEEVKKHEKAIKELGYEIESLLAFRDKLDKEKEKENVKN